MAERPASASAATGLCDLLERSPYDRGGGDGRGCTNTIPLQIAGTFAQAAEFMHPRGSDLPCAQVALVAGLSFAAVACDRGLAGSEDRPDEDGDDEGDGNNQGDVEGGCGPAEGCDGHFGVLLSRCAFRRSVGRR